MISLLTGKIASKALGKVVIDVGGVGYGVTVPLMTYYSLPDIDSDVRLLIHTSVRDDAIDLYGFLTELERSLFEELIGVTGIGPRAATNILSNIAPEDLVQAIRSGSLKDRKIPGIGPKLSSRLVTELSDRVTALSGLGDGSIPQGSIVESVISALGNLGYKKSEIERNMLGIEEAVQDVVDLEQALKQALKAMSA